MYIGTRIEYIHTLLRLKHTYKQVTCIVMTGLCSIPDWRGKRLFKTKCIDWKIQHNMPQAGSTHSSKYTH